MGLWDSGMREKEELPKKKKKIVLWPQKTNFTELKYLLFIIINFLLPKTILFQHKIIFQQVETKKVNKNYIYLFSKIFLTYSDR